jgi:hypothetical protein
MWGGHCSKLLALESTRDILFSLFFAYFCTPEKKESLIFTSSFGKMKNENDLGK